LNRSLFTLIIILSLGLPAEAQNDKRDYVWLFGHDSRPTEGFESYRFDFNKGSNPDSVRGLLPIRFGGNNASICDRDGNLLYYTNGCHVVGRNHQILPNGSDLNYGEWIQEYRGDTCSFYPTTQDILILPDPADEDNHYVIHKTIEGEDLDYNSFLYSYIDGAENNGFGEVKQKAENIFPDIKFLYSYLTAVPHENNNGWWIIQVDEDEMIYSILLNENGFNFLHTTVIPTSFVENSNGSGAAKLSPDGSLYVFYNAYDDLHLYDFDRETGKLTNHRYLLIDEFPDNIARFSSVEWSPNSRFIYISIEDQLWQVDTWEDDLEDGLVLIDTWNGVSDPFQTKFALMALAPDCNIYMCSFSSTNTYHVINNPNEKGQDCDFVQQGIRLPFVSASTTMPNFPRYRVDEDDKCDPTITSIFGDDIFWRKDLSAYPNPVRDQLIVELPEVGRGQLFVIDMKGQLVMQKKTELHYNMLQLDMTSLSAGTYSVEFLPDNNKERRIWTSRIVKVE